LKAYCQIRTDPVYRREAFCKGLAAVGASVVLGGVPKAQAGDALLIWNRYGEWHNMASRFEDEGGTVIVAENAYLGVDRSNRMRYAIALDGHNGSGAWPMGGPERWDALGIALQPWRTSGDHILLCPNRSFGRPDMIMPNLWAEKTAEELRRYTKRPVRIRPHPGNGPPKVPLADDLRNAHAVVVWSSSAGCEALVAGIPVFCCGPYWIARGAVSRGGLRTIDNPQLPDRLPAMHRLAWAQWHVEEIASGEPFQHLLYRPSAFEGPV
jgi:hypothetical protein